MSVEIFLCKFCTLCTISGQKKRSNLLAAFSESCDFSYLFIIDSNKSGDNDKSPNNFSAARFFQHFSQAFFPFFPQLLHTLLFYYHARSLQARSTIGTPIKL